MKLIRNGLFSDIIGGVGDLKFSDLIRWREMETLKLFSWILLVTGSQGFLIKPQKTIPKFPPLAKNSKNIKSRQELFIHIKQKDTMTIILILKRRMKRNIMRNNLSWFRDRGTTAAEWKERNKQTWADFVLCDVQRIVTVD